MTLLGRALPALSDASQAVVIRLLTRGAASRADLRRSLALSAPSVTRNVRSLEQDGLVVDGGWAATGTQRTGRPSQSIDINAGAVHLIGIKLSASEMVLVRTERSRVLDHRVVVLDDSSVDVVLDVIVREVHKQIRTDPTVAGIGISLAGPVSPRSDVVALSPFLQWANVPLRGLVQDRIGLPVVVDNDVRALTAATHWFGAGAGCSDFLLVTVGAGVGCGIVVDDQVLTGANGSTGHLPISESGPLCEIGHRGCARAYLTTSAIVQHAAIALSASDLIYADVLELARTNNHVARRIVDDAGHALGTVIGTLATINAPSKVSSPVRVRNSSRWQRT